MARLCVRGEELGVMARLRGEELGGDGKAQR